MFSHFKRIRNEPYLNFCMSVSNSCSRVFVPFSQENGSTDFHKICYLFYTAGEGFIGFFKLTYLF